MPENLPTAARYVFVYGTLRRGGSNDITRLQPAPRFVAQASLPGVMYHLGHYPGVLLGGSGVVCGEIYEISVEVERQLDVIEEVWPQPTGEYAKREVLVQVGPVRDPAGDLPSIPAVFPAGARLSCIVYELNPDRVLGHARVSSGDWFKSTTADGAC